jgi:predicted nucleic acid-binding protein
MAAFSHDARSVDGFCATMRSFALAVIDIPAIEPACRDPDDDHVLAAGADCIVTGDAHLRSLGSYGDIRILSVRALFGES